jgi:hypothetical protein
MDDLPCVDGLGVRRVFVIEDHSEQSRRHARSNLDARSVALGSLNEFAGFVITYSEAGEPFRFDGLASHVTGKRDRLRTDGGRK